MVPSIGSVIAPCAGMTNGLCPPSVDSFWGLPAGANCPPTLYGLLAGQRGCFVGFQSAFRSPLICSCRKRSIVASGLSFDLTITGGSGICRCSVAICAWSKSFQLSASQITQSPLTFSIELDGNPVASSKVTVEIRYGTHLPFSISGRSSASHQQWHRGDKYAVPAAEDSSARLAGQTVSSSNSVH